MTPTAIKTALPGCPACGGTGWVRLTKDGAQGVSRCDCFRHTRIERLLAAAKVPERYKHCELSNFELREPLTTQSIELAKIAAENFVEEYPHATPFGLLFMGPQGVGKTHLSVGIVKSLIRRKAIQCMFRTFPELLKEIQLSYSPISESSEYTLLAPVLDSEVLVLDELGSMKQSAWVKDTVSYILNYRYSENKVTIFTTNYQDHEDLHSDRKGLHDSLSQRIGEQMRSRLFEMCKTIPMKGKDFREEIKQAHHQPFRRARRET